MRSALLLSIYKRVSIPCRMVLKLCSLLEVWATLLSWERLSLKPLRHVSSSWASKDGAWVAAVILATHLAGRKLNQMV